MWEELPSIISFILKWQTLVYVSAGLVSGIIIGAIPGLTTTLGMALFLPFTFFMSPLEGIPFLIGLYKGGIYGGSIPAILLNTPGTGAAVATTIDGFQLSKKGQAGKALKVALYSSCIGNTFSDILTITLIGFFASWATNIKRPDFFMIILFSCTMISGVSGKSIFKGLISGGIGLLLSTVGVEAIAGTPRFNFGILELQRGLSFVVVLIGLFGLSEIIIQAKDISNLKKGISKISLKGKENILKWAEFRPCIRGIAIGSFIGAFLGAIPGIGQPVAAFLGYSSVKTTSKNSNKFGTGILEGVAAPEAANNAVNGTTLIPLLSLGIPGDLVTAIMLGAFVAQGIRPGPFIFAQHGPTITRILAAMLFGNLLLFFIGKALIPYFARITIIPKVILLPSLALILLVGSYAVNNSFFDIVITISFGVVGYALRKASIPLAPLVITFILGRYLEVSFLQSLLLLKHPMQILTDYPIALTFFILTFVMVAVFTYLNKKEKELEKVASKKLNEE
jgi:putative tricarboxylic transport membrane protein